MAEATGETRTLDLTCTDGLQSCLVCIRQKINLLLRYMGHQEVSEEQWKSAEILTCVLDYIHNQVREAGELSTEDRGESIPELDPSATPDQVSARLQEYVQDVLSAMWHCLTQVSSRKMTLEKRMDKMASDEKAMETVMELSMCDRVLGVLESMKDKMLVEKKRLAEEAEKRG